MVGGAGDVGQGVGHGVGVASGVDTVTHEEARSTTVTAEGTVVGVSPSWTMAVGCATGASSFRETRARMTASSRTAAAAITTGGGLPRLLRALEIRNPGSSSFTPTRYLIPGPHSSRSRVSAPKAREIHGLVRESREYDGTPFHQAAKRGQIAAAALAAAISSWLSVAALRLVDFSSRCSWGSRPRL